MALTRTYLAAQPVLNDRGRAALSVSDAQVGGVYPRVSATASDGGSIVALTYSDGQILAHPVAVGTATVTITAYEGSGGTGAVVTGTATVAVTTGGNGKLQAAWVSGAGATIH